MVVRAKIHIILFAILALMVSGGVTMLLHWITTLDQITVACDHRLAHSVQYQVTQLIEQGILEKQLAPADLAAAIIEQLPCIQSLAFTRCVPHTMHCEVEAANPSVAINHDHVLTDNGRLLARSSFTNHATERLYTVSVPGKIQDFNPHACAQVIKQSASMFLTRYHCTWVDSHAIYLQEKEDPNFSLLCSAHTLPNAQLIAWCKNIQHNIINQPQKDRKKGIQQWVADIRFENQIIMSGEKGGIYG